METITLKELAWLHDCVLLDVTYDASSEAGRLVKWRMRCPADLGYAPWNGKELVLLAVDVYMLRHIAWGFVAGAETVNAIRPGISDDAQKTTVDARLAGIRFPDIEFTIDMHSGSWIEVVCRKLEVQIL